MKSLTLKMAAVSVAVAGIFAAGCKPLDAVDATVGMPERMDKMHDTMDEGLRKQKLAIALDNLFKAENTAYLNPPTGMMPWGKLFAENATAEELSEIAYLYTREMGEVVPHEWCDTSDLNAPCVVDFDHMKMTTLTALMIIAGFTPQKSVEQMVTQILRAERYEPYIYRFLALRVLFIKVYLVEQGLFAYRLTNPGMLEKAISYLDQIDYVAKLPFAERVSIRTTGFVNQDLNLDLTVVGGTPETNVFGDDGSPIGLWRRMSMALATDLDRAYRLDEKGRPLEPMPASRIRQMRSIKNRIEKGVTEWESLLGLQGL